MDKDVKKADEEAIPEGVLCWVEFVLDTFFGPEDDEETSSDEKPSPLEYTPDILFIGDDEDEPEK